MYSTHSCQGWRLPFFVLRNEGIHYRTELDRFMPWNQVSLSQSLFTGVIPWVFISNNLSYILAAEVREDLSHILSLVLLQLRALGYLLPSGPKKIYNVVITIRIPCAIWSSHFAGGCPGRRAFCWDVAVIGPHYCLHQLLLPHKDIVNVSQRFFFWVHGRFQ